MADPVHSPWDDLTSLNPTVLLGEIPLSQFLQALPVGVVVIDRGGCVTYMNPWGRDLLGRGVIPGNTCDRRSELYQLYQAGTDQWYPWDHLPSVRALQGETITIDDMEVRRDGQVISLDVRALPVRNAQGTVIAAIAIFHDRRKPKGAESPCPQRVAAYPQAELGWQSSAAQLRDLLENTAALISSIRLYRDRTWEYDYISPRSVDILGFTPEELRATPDLWQSRLPQEDMQAIAPDLERIFQEGTINLEYRFWRKIGDLCWLSQSLISRWDESADCWRITAVTTDITARKQIEQLRANYSRTLEQQVQERTLALKQEIRERKLAEAELTRQRDFLRQSKETAEAANRAKSTFLANVSHELRTPLHAILGFSKLMQDEDNHTIEQRENLVIIHRSGEHLLRLINQMLDLSRIEAGQMTITRHPFDLYSLLTEIEHLFALKVKDKQLTLRVEYDSSIPRYVCTDEIKLRQILINLVGNAIKFTPQGNIYLRIRADDSPGKEPQLGVPDAGDVNQLRLYFEVEDTGIGLSSQDFDRLFQAFSQTAASAENAAGTGLGLVISHQFVRLLGGEIRVSSRGKTIKPDSLDSQMVDDKTAIGIAGTLFQFNIQVSLAELPVENKTESAIAASMDLVQIKKEMLETSMVGAEILNSAELQKSLKTLSVEWLDCFQQALIEGDIGSMQRFIQQLPIAEIRLANQLSALVNQYQFEPLLSLVQSIQV